MVARVRGAVLSDLAIDLYTIPGPRERNVDGLASLCGIVPLHRILLLYAWHAPPTYLYTASDARMDSLATGCLLAISIRTGKASRFVQRVRVHWTLPVFTFVLFALSMAIPSVKCGSLSWNVEGFTVESPLSAIMIVQMVV